MSPKCCLSLWKKEVQVHVQFVPTYIDWQSEKAFNFFKKVKNLVFSYKFHVRKKEKNFRQRKLLTLTLNSSKLSWTWSLLSLFLFLLEPRYFLFLFFVLLFKYLYPTGPSLPESFCKSCLIFYTESKNVFFCQRNDFDRTVKTKKNKTKKCVIPKKNKKKQAYYY